MNRWHRFWRVAALVSCGGALWMWGAGSCLPYNFYSTLLGDAIIGTVVSTVAGTLAGNLVAAE